MPSIINRSNMPLIRPIGYNKTFATEEDCRNIAAAGPGQ